MNSGKGALMPSVTIAQLDLAPGGEAETVPGAGASLRRIHAAAGRKAERHSHPHEQFVLVISGAGRLECEAGSVELRPGTVLRFAPGAWHSAEFTDDMVIVEVNLAECPR